VQLLQNAGKRSKEAVKISNGLGQWFNISINSKHGDQASPLQFIIYLERVTDGLRTIDPELSLKGDESTT